MGIFELQDAGGKTFEVDAPDMNAAVSAFQKMQGPQAAASPNPAAPAENTYNWGDMAARAGMAVAGNPMAAFTANQDQVNTLKNAASGVTAGVGYAGAAQEGAANFLKSGINYGLGKVIPGYEEGVAKADALRAQNKMIPSPFEATQTLDQNLYQPTTPEGKVGRAALTAIPASLALTPNALTSIPNAANAAARFGAAPAVAGETTRQAFEGTALETPMSMLASLGTGIGAGMLPKGVKAPLTGPSVQDLKGQAKAAYDRVDAANVMVPATEYQSGMNKLFTTLGQEGFDPTLHPKAAVALRRMDELRGQDVGFNTMETMRKIAQGAAGSIEKDERRIGMIMLRQLDDFVDNLPSNVGNEVKEARSIWHQVKKSEAIEELIQRAKDSAPNFSGSGYENALRREFIRFVKDPDNLRGYSQQEIAALRNVAQGGPMENILRWAGKAAPTGIVSGAGSAGIGYALAGPIGAAAVPAAGFLARQGATKMTERNANTVAELMRTGHLPTKNSPSAAVLFRALMEGQ